MNGGRDHEGGVEFSRQIVGIVVEVHTWHRKKQR